MPPLNMCIWLIIEEHLISQLKRIYKSDNFVELLPGGVGSLGDTIDAPLKWAFMFTETRLKAKGTIRGTGNVPGPPGKG